MRLTCEQYRYARRFVLIGKSQHLVLYIAASLFISCTTVWSEEAAPDSVVASGMIVYEGEPVPGASVFIHKTQHDFFEGDKITVTLFGKSGRDGTFAAIIPN